MQFCNCAWVFMCWTYVLSKARFMMVFNVVAVPGMWAFVVAFSRALAWSGSF